MDLGPNLLELESTPTTRMIGRHVTISIFNLNYTE